MLDSEWSVNPSKRWMNIDSVFHENRTLWCFDLVVISWKERFINPHECTAHHFLKTSPQLQSCECELLIFRRTSEYEC